MLGGLGEQGHHGSHVLETVVLGLAAHPPHVDLLDDHRRLEQGEGFIEAQVVQVEARPLGVALGVASSLLLAGCSVFGYRGGTETPDYTVVDQVRDLEIRDYAPRLAADTVVQAATVEKARKQGFKRLAGYIFGDNQAGEEMAMTAPVAQSSKKIEI